MKTLPLSVTGIDARLKDIESERVALLALRRVYQSDSDEQPEAKTVTKPELPLSNAPASPVRTPGTPIIVATGATAAIRETVAENPGIEIAALIDKVLEKVPPTHQMKPRKNISNIIGQQVEKKKLLKTKEGGYFLMQEDL